MVSVRAALERSTGELERARVEKRETRQRPALSLGLALLALVFALVALVGVVALSSGLSGLTGQTASIKCDRTATRGVASPALPLPVTEALDACELCVRSGYNLHPCGSRGDRTSIADFAIGLSAGQIRATDYNRVIQIERQLGDTIKWPGRKFFKGEKNQNA